MKKIPNATRRAVYERDEHTCAICRDGRVIHVHHIKFRGQGGSNLLENLICLCPTCHAVAHGEFEFINDFPFDQGTIDDAINYYIEMAVYNDIILNPSLTFCEKSALLEAEYPSFTGFLEV
jgi:hypothetical protein